MSKKKISRRILDQEMENLLKISDKKVVQGSLSWTSPDTWFMVFVKILLGACC